MPIGTLPTNEAQARPLAKLEPEQQREACCVCHGRHGHPASITALRLVGWLAILAGLVLSAILSEETSDLVLVFASFGSTVIFAVFCFGLASLINEVNLLRLDVRDSMQPRPRFDAQTGEPL